MALTQVVKETLWLQGILTDLGAELGNIEQIYEISTSTMKVR